MGLVVIIEAHDDPRKFWIFKNMCEILISYTRIQTNQVFILQVFSDILVHLKIVSTNVTHQPSLCYYPCVKDVSCIELSNVWKILYKKTEDPRTLTKNTEFF